MKGYQQILDAFNSANNERISRLAELAPKYQQLFFQVLPLLFHSNTEILATPFDKTTPFGVAGYQPSKTQLDAASQINHKFEFKRTLLRDYPILGIYLINDAGLLFYPDKPQFELWVVITDDQENTNRQTLLETKLGIISDWASSLGIILTTKILTEDPSTQYNLDFYQHERLYLNGLVMAGATPLWWLISPEESYQIVAKARQTEPPLDRAHLINFGDMPKMKAEDLKKRAINALDSQLENTLDKIYQLQFIAHQIANFETAQQPLSALMKQRFYQGDFEVLDLDSNVLKLKQIMASSISHDHRNLAIQSFYLASKERLSQQVKNPTHQWRRNFISEISQTWAWPENRFKQIDSRINNYERSHTEFIQSLAIFNLMLKNIHTFSHRYNLEHYELESSITNRLDYLSSDKPDAYISQLPAKLTINNSEEYLYIYRFKDASTWFINNSAITSPSETVLHKHESLLHLVTWAILNGVLDKSSRTTLADANSIITASKLQKLIDQLLENPVITTPPLETSAINKNRTELQYVYLVVNLENKVINQFDQQGFKLSSLQNDPLNHADRGESLISSIDGLIYSSQGEWQVLKHEGLTSPLETLTTLSSWWDKAPSHQIDVWCQSDSVKKVISTRIKNLYLDVFDKFSTHTPSGNYVLKIGDFFYQLQWQSNGFDFNLLSKSKDLVTALNKQREEFSLTTLDSYLDRNGLIKTLLSFQKPNTISCFINETEESIYIIDEVGLLTKQHYSNLTITTLARHFYSFLNTRIKELSNVSLFFYQLSQKAEWQAIKIEKPIQAKLGYLPVSVSMESPHQSATCTIQCGPQKFSGKISDLELFKQVADFTLSIRKANKNYPLYISELQFKNTSSASTIDYLKTKQFIEKHLNMV